MTPAGTRALLLMLLFVAPGASGCITAEAWRVAESSTVGRPEFEGVLVSPAGRPQAAVVRYGGMWSYDLPLARDLFAVIPLGNDGEPAPPFGYSGHQRQAEKIVQDLGEARRRQVLAGSFDWAWGREADEVLKSPHFRPVMLLRPGGEFWADAREHQELVIFGFGRTTHGAVPELAAYPGPLHDSARIVVVPAVAPRPERQWAQAKWEAAARTPLTLAWDASTPALLVLSLFGVVPPP
jgi:hypothetical protein